MRRQCVYMHTQRRRRMKVELDDATMNQDLFRACLKGRLRAWRGEIDAVLKFLDTEFCECCGQEVKEKKDDEG